MATWEIKDVSKQYRSGKVKALSHVNLSIEPGLFGLLGPNGAGKTTLMRILATVLAADSGEVHFGKLDWSRPQDVTRNLGYLPQHFNVYKYLTVGEALDDIALFKGVPKGERKKHVELALERSHMTEFAKRRIGQLSGGMLRRVGIAQALVGEPKVLIVDEPSAGLDPTERIHLRKLLRDYADGRRAVLISSHIVEDIESLCDQVAVLNRGTIRAHGRMKDVRALAEGRVAETVMSRQEYYDMEEDHAVIAFWPEEEGEGVRVRYLLKEGETSPYIVMPKLEDSYTLVIGGGKQ